MKDWLVSVAAASILSAVAAALCPAGRVKAILRLVCGIVCALALISPVAQLDITALSASMEGYGREAQIIAENAEEEKKLLERTYIEERFAAYISDKAAALGVEAGAVTVQARWDDDTLVWYPYEATLGCERSDALSREIEAALGIPAERQYWSEP